MIDRLDKRIGKLQEIKRLILEEFGANGPETASPALLLVEAVNGTGNIKSLSGEPKGASRKIVIHQWLKDHGPAGRGEVIEATGFPAGTVGSLLSQCKDLFESRDGKWHAR
ncbi:MAG: hypothetical protein ABI972_29055 [Acidobacteriota bacterium]